MAPMHTRLLFAAVLLTVLAPAQAQAQASDNSFGIGAVLGEPTGVTARFMHGGNNFQAHAAWSLDNDALHVSADYLRSGNIQAGSDIPFYFGLGAVLALANDVVLGARVPVGLNHFFSSQPLEIFAEIVPILTVAPSTDFALNGALGLRYYP